MKTKAPKVKSVTKTKDPLEYIKRLKIEQLDHAFIQVLGSDSYGNRIVGLIEVRDRSGSDAGVYLTAGQLREFGTACTEMADLIEQSRKKD